MSAETKPYARRYFDPIAFLRDASDLDLTDATQEHGECGGEFLVTGPKMPRVVVWLGQKTSDDSPEENDFEVEE
jgi:hypothetical protein